MRWSRVPSSGATSSRSPTRRQATPRQAFFIGMLDTRKDVFVCLGESMTGYVGQGNVVVVPEQNLSIQVRLIQQRICTIMEEK